MIKDIKIGIIGLGYVGFPLAYEFSKQFEVFGLDISKNRIKQLENNYDITNEIDFSKDSSPLIKLTSNLEDLSGCNIFIITVPTPVDASNNPDLTMLKNASNDVGTILKKNDIVIFESTVYPGATEEVCIPLLEKSSSLIFNKDFFVGYSPERINPGDKEHTVRNIKKVISGSTSESTKVIYDLYSSIIDAGVYQAPSIKVAEAAKVIENTQRDINIALMNELAVIFDLLDIDTTEVLEAAGTKWNFLKFHPGLVGGHCIGVDPYYLSYKSQMEGYSPEIVLSGRRLNNSMAKFVASKFINILISKSIDLNNANILIMGLTFKEDCPDIRNSKVFDVINELKIHCKNIDVYDPHVDRSMSDVKKINLVNCPKNNHYDGMIFCVKHKEFFDREQHNINEYLKEVSGVYDVTASLDQSIVDERL